MGNKNVNASASKALGETYLTFTDSLIRHMDELSGVLVSILYRNDYKRYLTSLFLEDTPGIITLENKFKFKYAKKGYRNSKNKEYMNEVITTLNPWLKNEETVIKFIEEEMDVQAKFKSIAYNKENLNIARNSISSLNKGMLLNCLKVRNSYSSAHANAKTYQDFTVEKYFQKVIKPFEIFIKACSKLKDPKLDECRQNFDLACRKAIDVLGCPPIEIGAFSKMSGLEESAIHHFAIQLNLNMKKNYIIGISESDLLGKIRDIENGKQGLAIKEKLEQAGITYDDVTKMLNPTLMVEKSAPTQMIHFKRLNYLQGYVKGALNSFEKKELYTRYNVLLDESVLLHTNALRYLSYTVAPMLKSLKRIFLVHRNVRYNIYSIEEQMKQAMDSLLDAIGEKEMSDEELAEYESYRKEYKLAQNARMMMDRMKHDKVLQYVGNVDPVLNSEDAMVEYIKRYREFRFLVFTLNATYAEELYEIKQPRICAGRIFADEEMFIWKKFIPYFTMSHDLEMVDMQNKQERQVDASLSEKKEETIKVVLKESSKEKQVDEDFDGKQNTEKFRMETEVIRTKDMRIQLKGSIPKSNDAVYRSNGSSLILGKQLGVGGEGVVYEVLHSKEVAKIYHVERITENRKAKLMLMTSKKINLKEVCWPTEVLFNEKQEFVGYLMPAAGKDEIELGASVMKIAGEHVHQTLLPNWNRLDLVNLASTIAEVFAKMHKRNILMGDINVRNIMIDPKDSSKISLVDCDSYQVGKYPCPVGTLEFTAPSIYDRLQTENPNYATFLRTKAEEEYALASLLFQILMLGQTAYASKLDTKDVLTAMRQYTFTYRSAKGKNSGKDMPDGPFRMIWSNTPKLIKGMFEDVFTGEKTYSAMVWKKQMNWYKNGIEKGDYTDELKPKKYYTKGYEDKFENFACDLCGVETNMPKETYDWQKARNYVMLCNECKAATNLFKKIPVTLRCSHCGNLYSSTKYEELWVKRYGKRTYCPICKK